MIVPIIPNPRMNVPPYAVFRIGLLIYNNIIPFQAGGTVKAVLIM